MLNNLFDDPHPGFLLFLILFIACAESPELSPQLSKVDPSFHLKPIESATLGRPVPCSGRSSM
jgi:hypothetical protein